MARIRLQPVATKLTCPSPTTTTGARGPRFHAGDEVLPYTTCERHSSFARQTEWKKHKLCLCFPYTHTSSQPEGTTTLPSLQSILIDDNGTPATWTLGLVFQQAIDRQDRTQVEGRFNYWNHWRYTLDSGLLPLPDKDSSHDDMPCRHTTPLRLPPCRDNDKPTGSSLLANTHLAGPQTSHRAPPSLTPSLDTNDISPGHNPIS